jgi:aryl-alcohol dehydrogenase-like predicted oxidoreductase
MEYITLGNSDLKVSRLGFGCCPMGMHGWGAVDKRDLISAVRIALDEGVTLFDTADIYGLGMSENILGEALGSHRSKVVIASKFGARWTKEGRIVYDNSIPWIRTALDESLKRLNTDYIDLYQLHYWDRITPLDETFEFLELSRTAGKIRYYGVTNIDVLDRGIKKMPDGLASFSFEYSLANRKFEERIMRLAVDYHLSFLSWGSLGQGILSGKYSENTVFPEIDRRSRSVYVNFHGKTFKKNLEIVSEMKRLLLSYPDKTLSQMAIRWILDYLNFGVVLVGIKKPVQIKENCRAFGWNLNKKDIHSLDRLSR